MDRIVETIDKTTAPSKADRKLSILSPGTIKVTNHSTTALTTNENRPKVRKFNGAVKKTRAGFIKVFISPRTRAANKAEVKPVTLKPGTT